MPASDPKKLPGIFISYRRSDNPDAVGRIYDRLVSEFGKARVFKDVDSIPLGQDFRGHLNDIVGNCAAVLAIVGPKWTDVRNEAGNRRLEDPDDFVRIELEAALARSVPVVPVLVGHAAMPRAGQLPSSLTSLVYRQSIEARPDPDFHNDVTRLVMALRLIIDPDTPPEELFGGQSRRSRPSWIRWVIALAAAMTLAAVGFAIPALKHLRELPPAETRVEIVTPDTDYPDAFALSPNGRQIVFAAMADGTSRLWLRSLASTTAQPLPGTEGGFSPFWSPDGRTIAFFADGNLKRLELSGKQAQVLAPANSPASGTWSKEGVILFANGWANPLSRIAAAGGEVTVATQLVAGAGYHWRPRFLPDGRRYLFASRNGEGAGIHLGSLDGGQPVRLTPDSGPFEFLPDGWLLRAKAGALLAQRLDVDNAKLVGDPEPMAEGVSEVSVAATGLLAYRSPAASTRQLVWRDRAGAQLEVLGEPDPTYFGPSVSPDGRTVGVSRRAQGNFNVWVLDPSHSSRATFTRGIDFYPTWSPDGTRFVFTSQSTSSFDMYQKLANAAADPEQLTSADRVMAPTGWSADGRYLLYLVVDPLTQSDVWVLPMTGERKPFAFLKAKADEGWARFSPDGKWVAYQARDSGRFEIYVRQFVEPDATGEIPTAASGKWQVSVAGGITPLWSANGKELFFIDPAGDMTAAPIVMNGSAVTAGTPVKLFQTRVFGGGSGAEQGRQYDVARDGRFLVNTVVNTEAEPPITLIQNWNPDAGK